MISALGNAIHGAVKRPPTPSGIADRIKDANSTIPINTLTGRWWNFSPISEPRYSFGIDLPGGFRISVTNCHPFRGSKWVVTCDPFFDIADIGVNDHATPYVARRAALEMIRGAIKKTCSELNSFVVVDIDSDTTQTEIGRV